MGKVTWGHFYPCSVGKMWVTVWNWIGRKFYWIGWEFYGKTREFYTIKGKNSIIEISIFILSSFQWLSVYDTTSICTELHFQREMTYASYRNHATLYKKENIYIERFYTQLFLQNTFYDIITLSRTHDFYRIALFIFSILQKWEML